MDIKILKERLTNIPSIWTGRAAILEMKEGDSAHWRQMEWIGFYFEFLCQEYIGSIMQIPGPRVNRVGFDGFLEFPWDFKVHPQFNSHGVPSSSVIFNDTETIIDAINKYGKVGVIIALGNATYNDQDRSFQIWHKELKGGLSPYERARIQRGANSRLRKVAFDLHELVFLEIEAKHLPKYAAFQEGFRNSNGNLRRPKLLINLNNLQDEVVGKIIFEREGVDSSTIIKPVTLGSILTPRLKETVDIPLVGSVPCGTPLLAEENVEEMIPVGKKKLQGGLKYFILRASGDSMDEAGINDGDLILCKQKLTARENDVVVALIDDEATVKEFHREGDKIVLKPRSTNTEHQPRYFTEGEGFSIRGIVQEVVRPLDA